MTEREELLAALEEAFLDLLSPLRMMQGFREDRFSQVLELMADFTVAFADDKTVPKRIGSVFVAACPALTACAEAYPRDEKKRIQSARDVLSEAIVRAIEDDTRG